MKLSKAQERRLGEAKANIDMARSYDTYEEYEYNNNRYWSGRYTLEEAREKISKNDNECNNFYSNLYKEYRKGKALVIANSRTIEKLEELGLIKIINIGGNYPDLIEVIGY